MSKPAKYKQTVLKNYPIEKAVVRFSDSERIKWEMRCQNSTVLRSNRTLTPEERFDSEIKYNYFVVDDDECQKNFDVAISRSIGSNTSNLINLKIQSLQSVTNFANLTRKNVYLLTFPIAKMMLRPQQHLRVFTDSLLEYIPILLRQQGTPIDKNDEKLKKYEKTWKTSENHLYNTIEIEELNEVLEDFDIDKSAISLVLDPVYSETSVQMLEKGSDPIYTISPDGEGVLGVFQAAHYIFQCLVCGIDWTSKIYKNQLDGLKKQILRVMNKYSNVQENLCVSKKSIDADIQVVKSNKRFLQHKKQFELWSGLNPTDNISIDTVIAFLNSFGITFSTNPECPLYSMKLCGESQIEIWMARLNTIDAWTEVFFNKDTEKLKEMVRESLGVRISESNRESLIIRFINPMEWKLASSTSSATSSESSTAKYKGSMWKRMNFPYCDSKWEIIAPEGPILCSNQCFLVPNINNARKANYFILDIGDRNLMQMFSYMRNELQLEIECYSSLTKFAEHCEKNIYIRSFIPGKLEQKLDLRVFTDDVLESIPILLEQQNTPLKRSDDRLEKLQKKWTPEATHLYSTIKDSELYQILEDFDINKEKVTRVPDVVHLQTADLMMESGRSPIVTYSPKTEVVMDIPQALLYTFQSLICGINWKTARQNEYNDFKEKVLVVLKEYANLREGTFLTEEYVDKNIGKLKKHSAYMERMTHQWPDYQMIYNNPTDKISLSEVSKIMTGLGLPVGPPGQVLFSIWQCRYSTMINAATVFFDGKLTKIHRLIRGAIIHVIPETEQNVFVHSHIRSEKDEIEEEFEKEEVVVNKTNAGDKVEPKNTETSSPSRSDDFGQNLRNAMRKKREIQKKKAEKQSTENMSEEIVQVEKSPEQKQSDTRTEEASIRKLNEEIEKLEEELHQLQVTFDLSKSNIENELTKKTQEVEDLKKQLEERKKIYSLQGFEDLDLD